MLDGISHRVGGSKAHLIRAINKQLIERNINVRCYARSNRDDCRAIDIQPVTVKIDGDQYDFASGLTWEHALSQTEIDLDPGTLAERFAPVVAPHLAARLSEDGEWLNYGDRWILKALLPEVNQGHRNLAEAVIMLAGEPLPASQILSDLGIDKKIPEETRAIALELSLAADERFRNVGALESPLWTLTAQL